MNLKIIIPIALILLVGISFVIAEMTPIPNTNNYDVEIYVYKGWNLIISTPILGTFEGDDYADSTITSDSEITRDNIKAVYHYLRGQNKYVQMYPDAQEYINYARTVPTEDADYIKFTSVWVYSNKAGILKYSRPDTPRYYEVALEDGWNFITVTPEMSGKSWNEIKGSCDIIKSYGWDPSTREWVNFPLDEDFYGGTVGAGLIIKLSDDCALGSSTNGGTSPPGLPGDGGTSIPPESDEISIDYPQEISEYSLESANLNDESECGEIEGEEVCLKSARLEYRNEEIKKAIHVIPTLVTKGEEAYMNYIKETSAEQVSTGVYRLEEEWELAWFGEEYFFVTQDYNYTEEDGDTSFSPDRARVDNPIVKYFLNKYPSKE